METVGYGTRNTLVDDERLSAVFAALADPTRRALLHRLSESDASVAELAEPFAMSQPAISRHLKVLEGAGLISRTRAGTARYSHLEAEPLKEATEYMERYKRFWTSAFDRLDAALASFQANGAQIDGAQTNPARASEAQDLPSPGDAAPSNLDTNHTEENRNA